MTKKLTTEVEATPRDYFKLLGGFFDMLEDAHFTPLASGGHPTPDHLVQMSTLTRALAAKNRTASTKLCPLGH